MKSLRFLLFTLISCLCINTIDAQCKIFEINEAAKSTKAAILGDGNSLAEIFIIKMDSVYLMHINYQRGMVNAMGINDTTPLIFYFDNNIEEKIYPVSNSITKMINPSDVSLVEGFFYAYHAVIGAKEIEIFYSITAEQLEFLANNIPNEIRLYYTTEKKPRHTDKYGNYWNIMKHKWHYKKRLIKILQCALENM